MSPIAALLGGTILEQAREAADRHSRLALLIGNVAYPEKPLKNPINDVRALKSVLKTRPNPGFDVEEVENATQAQAQNAIQDFLGKLTSGCIALFYYSGHGAQVEGQNYLISVDAQLGYTQALKNKSIPLLPLRDAIIEKNPAFGIIIVDACRENAFNTSRSFTKGLAGVINPFGTSIILFSTQFGKVAEDNPNGLHSPFATALLDALPRPGLTLHDISESIATQLAPVGQHPEYIESPGAAAKNFYFVPPVTAGSDLQPRVSRPALRPIHDKFALLVGIGDFANPRIESLRCARKDAWDFYEALVDPRLGRFPKEHVRVLTNESAITNQIKAELRWISNVAGPDDVVTVYFASHGWSRPGFSNVSYLLSYDTDVNSQDELFGTALPMVEIVTYVRTRLRAQRALFLLDFGYTSGLWVDVNPQQITSIEPASESIERGRVVIMPSSPGEGCYESVRYGNGFLMHFVLEALRSSQGNISALELYNYVAARIPSAVKAEFHRDQHPVLTMGGIETRFEIGQPIG